MPVLLYNCKLCQNDVDKLVDSHIIAQSIHALSTRAKDLAKAKILSSDLSQYPKKSPKGVYDKLFCEGCEKIFQKWEDYALELFRKDYELPIPTKFMYIKLDNYQYSKLKLFFISVLWKADVSGQHMYQGVDVGIKHREALRQMLLNEIPGDWQDYAVFIERFNSDKSYASIMRSPQKAKLGDIIFYIFYMAGFKIYIKFDSRKVPQRMAAFFLKDGQPLLIPLIPFEGSREHKEFIKLIYQTNNLKAFCSFRCHT